MTETGFFRTSLGGFHKQDVFRYIEQMEARHREELSAAQQQLEQQEEQVRQDEQQRQALKAEIGRLEAALAAQTEQAAAVQQALDEQRVHADALRADLEREAAVQADLRKQEASLREQIEALTSRIGQYEALMATAGDFAARMKDIGGAYLTKAADCAGACLEALQGTLAGMEQQLAEQRAQMQQLGDWLAEQASRAGATVQPPAQALEDQAARFDAASGEKSGFFR